MSGDGSPAAPRRAILRRVLLVAATVLVLLVVAIEIGSRLADGVIERRRAAPGFDPEKQPRDLAYKVAFATLDPAGQKNKDARTEAHPYLGYALKRSWSTPPSSAQQASHNALGFRGAETTWEKPAGVFRIVTLGGSSVYGQSESSDEAVWSRKLERYLAAARPATRFEVVNGGVPGYCSFEMLGQLALRMVDLAPDLVIVYEAINDMRFALWSAGGPVMHDNTHLRTPWPVDRPSALERKLEASRTYLVWRWYMTDYEDERIDLAHYAMKGFARGMPDPYVHDVVPDLGFETYERNLESILAIAERHGAKVAIATQALARYHLDGAPSKDTQLAGFDRIQAIERRVAAERGVLLIESARIVEAALDRELAERVEALRAQDPAAQKADLVRRAKDSLIAGRALIPPPGASIFKHEVHPYDEGSDLIARTIADVLLASDLVP